jgi:hypothetical protein
MPNSIRSVLTIILRAGETVLKIIWRLRSA